jgi:threonine dehydrogenase-like Zn-dependent dehydrogenase
LVAVKEIAVKKYVVKLGTEERNRLNAAIHSGKHPAQRLVKARTHRQLVEEGFDAG